MHLLRLHLLLFFLSHLPRHLANLLAVVEGVLRDVSHAQVGVLPHSARAGLHLPRKQLDHGGLSSAIGTYDGHPGVQAAHDSNARQHLLGGARVGERVVVHLQDRAVFALDALQETGLWELELHLGSTELITLSRKPESWETTMLVTSGKFVRQRSNWGLQHLLREPDTGKHTLNMAMGRMGGICTIDHHMSEQRSTVQSKGGIVEDELQHGCVSLRCINVVLHVHRAQLLLWGEALQLAISNGSHESGLSRAIGTAETVSPAPLEVRSRVLVNLNHLLPSLLHAQSQEGTANNLDITLLDDWRQRTYLGLVNLLLGAGLDNFLERRQNHRLIDGLGRSELALASHTDECGMGLGCHLPALGIRHLLAHLLQAREELRQEGGGVCGVVHKLHDTGSNLACSVTRTPEHSETTGTISGRQAANCRGAFFDKSSRSSSARDFCCHDLVYSMFSRRTGTTILVACGEMISNSLVTAEFAKVCTGFDCTCQHTNFDEKLATHMLRHLKATSLTEHASHNIASTDVTSLCTQAFRWCAYLVTKALHQVAQYGHYIGLAVTLALALKKAHDSLQSSLASHS
eukprot:SM000007S20758  [mRNA]  locus=s7:31297:34761:+ [translate_table: standard]